MRLILLALSLALVNELKVKQGSVAYDPPEGRRVQEWAKSVDAKIAKELE